MVLFKGSYLVRLHADIYPPNRVAIRVEGKSGRWPEYESGDRLTMAIGFCALTLTKSAPSRLEVLKLSLRNLASVIAQTSSGSLPRDVAPLDALSVPGLLEVVEWQGPGQVQLEADLVKSATGRTPRMRKEPKTSGPTREIAALGALVAIANDASADERLSLALGLEGLLAWFRQSEGASSAKDLLAFATAHTDQRLREIGRSLPVGV
jgi:hypothetical protein